MGKPSSSSFTKSSECSINLNSSKQKGKVAMSAHKMNQIKKKNHNQVRQNIDKLFNKLKKDSVGPRNKCQDHIESALNTTPRNLTIVIQNESYTPPPRKRKSPDTLTIIGPNKTRRKSESFIMINDDDLTTNNDSCILISPPRSNTNIDCSTPITKRDSQTLKTFIIDNFPETAGSFNSKPSQNNTKEFNGTKIFNNDSYLTIDLTTESENKTNAEVTVIDVDKTPDFANQAEDCTLVSVSNSTLSMSGDSDVTVVRNNKLSSDKQMKKFTNGIAQLNATEKANLLKYIAEKIFSGCDLKNNIEKAQFMTSCATETDEDAYIREVILGESKNEDTPVTLSRNSIGSNVYHPSTDVKNTTGLRMVVIDGSNVAMEHTKGRIFSVKGLKICIDYFLRRGHVVKAFVPRFRCKFGKSSDPTLLDYLERQGLVVYTPSREIQGKTCVPYDDRYILQCAAAFDGIVVSGDNYRDLINENQRWRYIIENRILPFTWVDNMIMFPKDPFGRGGPSLETLLKHPTPSDSVNVIK